VIGRTEGELVIADKNISRLHAQIDYDSGQRTYVITDLNSSNGISVNGSRLAPNQRTALLSGCIIGLASTVTIKFE